MRVERRGRGTAPFLGLSKGVEEGARNFIDTSIADQQESALECQDQSKMIKRFATRES